MRNGLKSLLVGLVKGVQVATIYINDSHNLTILHDRYDYLRLRLRGASNMARKRMNVGDNQRPRLGP